MSRRSKRTPKKSYANDAFADLDELDDILGPQDPEPAVAGEPEDDFVADPGAEDEPNEDDLSIVASDDTASAFAADDDDLSIVVDRDAGKARKTGNKAGLKRRVSSRATGKDSGDESHSEHEKHSRAVMSNKSRPGRDPAGVMMIGNSFPEVQHLLAAKDTFFSDITLPHRRIALEYQSIAPPRWAAREIESTDTWDTESFGSQLLAGVEVDQLGFYTSRCKTISVLAGPPKAPKIFQMKSHTTLRLEDLFPGRAPADGSARPRPAWLLNMGEGIQCLEWAPNRSDGLQYLAMASAPVASSNAFSGSGPVPSTIEIWSFRATAQSQPGWSATIDMSEPPSRRLVVCTNFGHITALKWSQMKPLSTPGDSVDLGLLAVASSDGHMRVLSISCPPGSASPPRLLRPEAVAFDVAPPKTVCTCITWLSGSLLAAGCANGHVGVWDVESCAAAKSTTPVFWHEVSMTYIVSISACLPSRPGVLVTSSMDGFVRWTSVGDATTDSVASPRSRVGSTFVIWHDQSQHALHLEDLYNLRAINIRRGWSTVYVSTLAGPAQSAGVSVNHSAMLVGCTDGTVQVLNPMRRVFAKSFHNADYLQTWFTHDWRRGEPGLARLTTGYSIENAKDTTEAGVFNKNTHAPESQVQSRVTAKGVIFATTYEHEAGIRAVAWNPNPVAQGWAAAGMGDGLVLIEDLCWD